MRNEKLDIAIKRVLPATALALALGGGIPSALATGNSDNNNTNNDNSSNDSSLELEAALSAADRGAKSNAANEESTSLQDSDNDVSHSGNDTSRSGNDNRGREQTWNQPVASATLSAAVSGNDVDASDSEYVASNEIGDSFGSAAGITQAAQSSGTNSSVQQNVSLQSNATLSLGDNGHSSH